MKHILSAFIVSCIMANSLIPRLQLQAQEYDAVAAAVRSQKAFLQVFSLTLLPLQIMDGLLAESAGKAGPGRTPVPNKDSRDKSDGGAICSSSSERYEGAQRCIQSRHSLQTLWMPLTTLLQCSAVPGAEAPPGIFLCLLLFSCHLLARSGLCENAAFVYIRKAGIPARRVHCTCRVFHFYKRTSIPRKRSL